jgi:CRP/FNR family transcriptional regulator, cyclic AMP receptor protein
MRVEQLAEAVAKLDSKDALQCKLSIQEWKALAPYLAVRFLRTGEALMAEGDRSRELFILADGELEVSVGGSTFATLRPGNVVGEGTFFSGEPRSATVTPSGPGVAWGLHWDRFEALVAEQPKLAANLATGLAAVLAVRMREALLVGNFA